jgi:hypothetical protein
MTHLFPELLARSAATDEFKADLHAYAARQPAPRLTTSRHVPRIKVLRVLTQLLETEPALAIEHVHVDAVSGCSDFRGSLTVATAAGTRAYDFVWDCHWRALQEGWRDGFGLPDQIRAAHEFGHRCFERWQALPAAGDAAGAARRAG